MKPLGAHLLLGRSEKTEAGPGCPLRPGSPLGRPVCSVRRSCFKNCKPGQTFHGFQDLPLNGWCAGRCLCFTHPPRAPHCPAALITVCTGLSPPHLGWGKALARPAWMAAPTKQSWARQTLTDSDTGRQAACRAGRRGLQLHPHAHSAQPKVGAAGLAGPWPRALPKEGQAGAHTGLTHGLQEPQAAVSRLLSMAVPTPERLRRLRPAQLTAPQQPMAQAPQTQRWARAPMSLTALRSPPATATRHSASLARANALSAHRLTGLPALVRQGDQDGSLRVEWMPAGGDMGAMGPQADPHLSARGQGGTLCHNCLWLFSGPQC